MKDDKVHGGGAVLARISERFGRRLQYGLGIVLGIVTVSGCGGGEYSAIAMCVSSSSGSAEEVVGDDAVEDNVRTDKACPPSFREFITILHHSLYTRRALFLLCSSNPGQAQNCGRVCSASLTERAWHKGPQEPDTEGNNVERGGAIGPTRVALMRVE
jgi:hypothetical protein